MKLKMDVLQQHKALIYPEKNEVIPCLSFQTVNENVAIGLEEHCLGWASFPKCDVEFRRILLNLDSLKASIGGKRPELVKQELSTSID